MESQQERTEANYKRGQPPMKELKAEEEFANPNNGQQLTWKKKSLACPASKEPVTDSGVVGKGWKWETKSQAAKASFLVSLGSKGSESGSYSWDQLMCGLPVGSPGMWLSWDWSVIEASMFLLEWRRRTPVSPGRTVAWVLICVIGAWCFWKTS